MTSKPTKPDSLPDLECACATVRRAARLVTQLYDEELRPDLEAPQFALLSVLERRPGASQAVLARMLGFDKTTISRNLRLVERKGWVEPSPGGDQRERGFRLTLAGGELLRAAKPRWRRAQERLRSAMTSVEWQRMWQGLRGLGDAAYSARHQNGGI